MVENRRKLVLGLWGLYAGLAVVMSLPMSSTHAGHEVLNSGGTRAAAMAVSIGHGLAWMAVPAVLHAFLIWKVVPETGRRAARLISVGIAIGLFSTLAILGASLTALEKPALLVFLGAVWGLLLKTPAELRAIGVPATGEAARSNGG